MIKTSKNYYDQKRKKTELIRKLESDRRSPQEAHIGFCTGAQDFALFPFYTHPWIISLLFACLFVCFCYSPRTLPVHFSFEMVTVGSTLYSSYCLLIQSWVGKEVVFPSFILLLSRKIQFSIFRIYSFVFAHNHLRVIVKNKSRFITLMC